MQFVGAKRSRPGLILHRPLSCPLFDIHDEFTVRIVDEEGKKPIVWLKLSLPDQSNSPDRTCARGVGPQLIAAGQWRRLGRAHRQDLISTAPGGFPLGEYRVIFCSPGKTRTCIQRQEPLAA